MSKAYPLSSTAIKDNLQWYTFIIDRQFDFFFSLHVSHRISIRNPKAPVSPTFQHQLIHSILPKTCSRGNFYIQRGFHEDFMKEFTSNVDLHLTRYRLVFATLAANATEYSLCDMGIDACSLQTVWSNYPLSDGLRCDLNSQLFHSPSIYLYIWPMYHPQHNYWCEPFRWHSIAYIRVRAQIKLSLVYLTTCS